MRFIFKRFYFFQKAAKGVKKRTFMLKNNDD
jgi:hypothetical protein